MKLSLLLDDPDHPTSVLNLSKLGQAIEKIIFGDAPPVVVSDVILRNHFVVILVPGS